MMMSSLLVMRRARSSYGIAAEQPVQTQFQRSYWEEFKWVKRKRSPQKQSRSADATPLRRGNAKSTAQGARVVEAHRKVRDRTVLPLPSHSPVRAAAVVP